MRAWRKAAFAAAAIGLVELGSRIGLYGVDRAALRMRPGFLLSVYEALGGGGLSRAGVLALGVLPYLSATAYMRLYRLIGPNAEMLTHSEGGRHRLRVRTRLVTTVLAVIQSAGLAAYLQRVPGAVAHPGPVFTAVTMASLTSGSLLMMWLGEKLMGGDDDEHAAPDPLSSSMVAPALASIETPLAPLASRAPASPQHSRTGP